MSNSRAVSDPGWLNFSRGDLTIPLLRLRRVQLAFLLALVMIARVAWLLESRLDASFALSATLILLAVHLVLGIGGSFLLERSLPAAHTLGLYNSRFFLRMAFANASALVGFVGAVVSATAWVYLVGFAFSMLGHIKAAPSRANIERDQEQLRCDGFDVNLLAVLMGSEDDTAS